MPNQTAIIGATAAAIVLSVSPPEHLNRFYILNFLAPCQYSSLIFPCSISLANAVWLHQNGLPTNTQSTLKLQSGVTVSSPVNPTGATVTRKAASQAPTVVIQATGSGGVAQYWGNGYSSGEYSSLYLYDSGYVKKDVSLSSQNINYTSSNSFNFLSNIKTIKMVTKQQGGLIIGVIIEKKDFFTDKKGLVYVSSRSDSPNEYPSSRGDISSPAENESLLNLTKGGFATGFSSSKKKCTMPNFFTENCSCPDQASPNLSFASVLNNPIDSYLAKNYNFCDGFDSTRSDTICFVRCS